MVAKYEIKGKVARANITIFRDKVVSTDPILCWMQGWGFNEVKEWCDLRYYMKLTKISG